MQQHRTHAAPPPPVGARATHAAVLPCSSLPRRRAAYAAARFSSPARRLPASVQDWTSCRQDYRGTLIEPGTINKKQSNAVDWCVDTMDLWYGNALVCTSG